jgi:predicted SprT family Zn-dependent metalloprotease
MMTNPTQRTYTSLTQVYDFFNAELFGGQLPPCLITMQRHKGAYGYFSGERFASLDDPQELTDEIALNPTQFRQRTTTETLSTLVHEMVHLWQHHHGKPPRKAYHDKQWAAKMREVGLIPTATGEPGGKETGQKMTHIIDERGPFARACAQLLAERPAILYHDRAGDDEEGRKTRQKKAASKTKYTCGGCGANAWAKPRTNLWCGDCQEAMQAEEQEDGEE